MGTYRLVVVGRGGKVYLKNQAWESEHKINMFSYENMSPRPITDCVFGEMLANLMVSSPRID